MRLLNRSNGDRIASRVERASGFAQKMLGLIGRAAVAPDEGLWIDRCSFIHTLGMSVPIDIVFLDGNRRVVKIAASVPSGRLIVGHPSARIVVELGHGAIDDRDLLLGDELTLET